MNKMALVDAKCAECGLNFSYPSLGDFNYGMLVFVGERGSVFAYMYAIDNPVWATIKQFAEKIGYSLESRTENVLASACAYFADPIDGQRLADKIRCPHCRSTRLEYWGGERTGSTEIPDATFSHFLSMSDELRREKLKDYFSSRSRA